MIVNAQKLSMRNCIQDLLRAGSEMRPSSAAVNRPGAVGAWAPTAPGVTVNRYLISPMDTILPPSTL